MKEESQGTYVGPLLSAAIKEYFAPKPKHNTSTYRRYTDWDFKPITISRPYIVSIADYLQLPDEDIDPELPNQLRNTP